MTAEISPVLDGQRILVVEDELLIAMELEAALKSAGCVVVGPVSSCAKAVKLIAEDDIDACVLDLNLNGKSGTPVARELLRREVPFLLVTGYSDAEFTEPELRDARRLAKPVEQNHLLRTLGEIVSAQPASGAATGEPGAGPAVES